MISIMIFPTATYSARCSPGSLTLPPSWGCPPLFTTVRRTGNVWTPFSAVRPCGASSTASPAAPRARIFSLPRGIYVVQRDGDFQKCRKNSPRRSGGPGRAAACRNGLPLPHSAPVPRPPQRQLDACVYGALHRAAEGQKRGVYRIALHRKRAEAV